MALWLLLGAAWRGHPDSTTSHRPEIIAALGSLRPVAGRLQGFPYSQPGQGDLTRLYADLVKDLQAAPGPRIRGEVAIVALAAGEPERAVRLLEAAVAVDSPEKVSLRNDLVVAYLVRGEALGQPRDFVRALDTAALAAEADSSLPEPCFNRALALERLHLVLQATAAWTDCIRREPDAGWGREMARHLRALLPSPQRPGDRLSAAQSEALEEILPAWGKAFLDGERAEADAALSQGRALGRDLARLGHDFTVAKTFETLARESADPAERARLVSLARGAQLYKAALVAFRSYRNEESLRLFEQARTLFSQAGSVLEAWAELGAIGCEFYRDDFDEVFVRLEALGPRVDAARFPLLAGRWHWIKGMAHSRRGELRATLREFEATAAHYKRAGDLEKLGTGYQLLGETYRLLGDEDEAWRYRTRGLALLRGLPQFKRRIFLLRDIAESLLAEGYDRAALAFQGEAVQAASASGDSRDFAEMLLWRARVLAQLGRLDGALADLQEARRQAAKVEDAELRDRALADIGFAEADIETRRTPARALALFDRSAAAYERKGHVLPLATLLLHRARAARALDLPDREVADLEAGIDLFERQWQSLDHDKDRVTFLETAQELYDARLLREVEHGEPAAALEYSERARAFWTGAPGSMDASWVRELAPAAEEGRACTTAEQEILPKGVAVLEYALAGDRLFLWLLRCDGLRFVAVQTSADRVADLAGQLRKAAQNGPPERFQALAETAYDLLLRPVARYLPPEAALVVVPDKDLHGVPFGALRDRATGRFLLEDREVAFAPSATFFRAALRRSALPADPGDALLVSAQNPDLRESGPEIEDLRRLYPGARVLAGTDARRDAILDALDEHWMLHYVGHAAVHPTDPFRSRLPLTPDGAEEITLYDLQGRTFERLDMVVLSACSSVGAAPTRTGGFLGLARPFLSGGVRSVVGTLWDIDDAASRAVLVAFHRELLRGRSPTAALRAAQLESLHKGWPPSAWAAFTVVGQRASLERNSYGWNI